MTRPEVRAALRAGAVQASLAGAIIAMGETLHIAWLRDAPSVRSYAVVLALAWMSATVLAAGLVATLLVASPVVSRALAAIGTVVVIIAVLVVGWHWPEANQAPPRTLAVLWVVVIAMRFAKPERIRCSLCTAGVLAILGVVGSMGIAWSSAARLNIVAHGVMSRLTAAAVWKLADRDGDGYAPTWIGGADCDDHDARRSPRRLEIPGNGIDENCTGADAPPAPGAPRDTVPGSPRMNVLLISVDTLRADHLGAWGYHRATSPAIDAFARTGARFASAVTASPSTRFAIPALFTGRFASTLGKSAPPPTLAQLLRASGYATTAVVCCQRLVDERELRGFATIDSSPDAARRASAGQSNAEAVTDAAIRVLETPAAAPFFLWTHYYDPHYPYEAPGAAPFGDARIDRYDAEIAYADREIGRLLAALDARALTPSTIVVLVADHGEEMDEHGIGFHARSLFQQVIHIPVVMRAPGTRPVVIEPAVSLVDVMPTILDLVGVAAPDAVNGRSLGPALAGGALPDRPGVLVELLPDSWFKRDAVGALSSRFKVIWARDANAWRLYARGDTTDAHELSTTNAKELTEMQLLLRQLMDRELTRR